MNRLIVTIDGHPHHITIEFPEKDPTTITALVDEEKFDVFVPKVGDPSLGKYGWMVINGRPIEFDYDRCLHWIMDRQGLHKIELKNQADDESSPGKFDGRIKASVPGRITDILVRVGQKVECGEPVAILEALDMFNELQAHGAGVIKSIYAVPGADVSRGDTILEIA